MVGIVQRMMSGDHRRMRRMMRMMTMEGRMMRRMIWTMRRVMGIMMRTK